MIVEVDIPNGKKVRLVDETSFNEEIVAITCARYGEENRNVCVGEFKVLDKECLISKCQEMFLFSSNRINQSLPEVHVDMLTSEH